MGLDGNILACSRWPYGMQIWEPEDEYTCVGVEPEDPNRHLLDTIGG